MPVFMVSKQDYGFPLSIKKSTTSPKDGLDNLQLMKYLIDQVRQSPEDRNDCASDSTVKMEDWELETAGQCPGY
jgi:malate dehydrogenase (quinone)